MLEESGRNEGTWGSRAKLVFIAFAVMGAFFLLVEHRAHVWPWWPWFPLLFLAACPLMHVFMHHGHSAHHHSGHGESSEPPNAASGIGQNAPPGPGHAGPDSTSHHQDGDRS